MSWGRELVAIYIVGIAVLLCFAYWLASMRARERALRVAKSACQRHGWPWLDDSLALRKIRIKRNRHGFVSFWREYIFEHGVSQRKAEIVIVFDQQAWLEGGDIDIDVENDDELDAAVTNNVIPFPKKSAND